MSYARTGSDSDVYVFRSGGAWFCYGTHADKGPDGGYARCSSLTELDEHLRAHVARGERVPSHAFKRIAEELAEDAVDAAKEPTE